MCQNHNYALISKPATPFNFFLARTLQPFIILLEKYCWLLCQTIISILYKRKCIKDHIRCKKDKSFCSHPTLFYLNREDWTLAVINVGHEDGLSARVKEQVERNLMTLLSSAEGDFTGRLKITCKGSTVDAVTVDCIDQLIGQSGKMEREELLDAELPSLYWRMHSQGALGQCLPVRW